MNRITILAAAACLSLAMNPLYADDAHHPEKAQKTMGAKNAPPAAAKTNKPAGPTAEQLRQAQKTMQKLQDKMGEIRSTKDPKARQKLMHEHMQTLQEAMMQMRGMGGGMMMGMGGGAQGGMGMGGGAQGGMGMGGGSQGGMMMGGGSQGGMMMGGGAQGGMMMGGDMAQTQEMMAVRMDMMQMMMEQMMLREEMREGMPGK